MLDSLVRAARALRKQGLTYRDISGVMGWSIPTAYKFTRTCRVPKSISPHQGKKHTAFLSAEHISRLLAGATLEEIGSERGCTREWVRQLAAKEGIVMHDVRPHITASRREERAFLACCERPPEPFGKVWDEVSNRRFSVIRKPLQTTAVAASKSTWLINGEEWRVSVCLKSWRSARSTIQAYARFGDWAVSVNRILVVDCPGFPSAVYVVPAGERPSLYIPLLDSSYNGNHACASWAPYRNAWHLLGKIEGKP